VTVSSVLTRKTSNILISIILKSLGSRECNV
jgi:hypothetical protein